MHSCLEANKSMLWFLLAKLVSFPCYSICKEIKDPLLFRDTLYVTLEHNLVITETTRVTRPHKILSASVKEFYATRTRRQLSASKTHSITTTHMFKLYKVFRLNLTFLNMYFSHITLPQCKLSYVEVIGVQPKHARHQLRYCGTFAQMTSYPESSYVVMRTITEPLTIVKATVLYSIIDFNRVANILRNIEIEDLHGSSFSFWLTGSYSLLFYHISLPHFLRIGLTVTGIHQDYFHSHDGPGIKSDPVSCTSHFPNSLKCMSSTFQMFLNILKNPQTVYEVNPTVKYASRTISTVVHVSVADDDDQLRWSLPNSNCTMSSKICLLQLETNRLYALNVTLTAFEYQGDSNTEYCAYAGVALYDIRGKAHHYIANKCVKEHHRIKYKRECFSKPGLKEVVMYFRSTTLVIDRYPKRGDSSIIFSKSNKFVLVFYSYQEYGSMQVNLTVTTTSCQILTMDNILETLAQDRISYVKSHKQYNMVPWKPSGCTIVQLHSFPGHQKSGICSVYVDLDSMCSFKIGFMDFFRRDRTLRLSVTAVLKSKYCK